MLIVAADPLARAGLATLLADQPGCIIVGQIGVETDLADMLEVYGPDVVAWDMGWEPGPHLDLLSDLPESGPPVAALLPDETHAAVARAAGARGLLLRDSDAADIVAALVAIARGLVVLDPQLATAVPPARDRSLAPPGAWWCSTHS